jgi:hypothetical protein
MPRDHWREFPRELDSFEQLPGDILTPLRSHLPSEDQVIRLYLIPQQRGFWDWFHDAPPRNTVFCLTSAEILIAREDRDKSVGVEHFKVKDVLAFQVGTVLLRSWLKMTLLRQGETEDILLSYGTVFGRQFRDAILWLRALIQTDHEEPQHAWRMPGEGHIKALPLKFNNAARAYWLAGESALASCFIEPLTTSPPIFRLLRRSYADATAIVLSDQAICVISEQGRSGAGKWGQVWHFCSLDHIADADIIEEDEFPEVRLRLATLPSHRTHHARPKQRNDATLRIPFDPQQRSDIERMLLTLEDCRTAKRSHPDRRTIREDSMKIELDGRHSSATR